MSLEGLVEQMLDTLPWKVHPSDPPGELVRRLDRIFHNGFLRVQWITLKTGLEEGRNAELARM